jgi:hypothetical protein
MGAFLLRAFGKPGMVPHFLRDHPEDQERDAALARFSKPSPMKVLLTPAEWGAVKNMCAAD